MTPFAMLCKEVTFAALLRPTEPSAPKGAKTYDIDMAYQGRQLPRKMMTFIGMDVPPSCLLVLSHWLEKAENDVKELLGTDYERFVEALGAPGVRFEVLCAGIGIEAMLDPASVGKDMPLFYPEGAYIVTLSYLGRETPPHRFGWHETPAAADVLGGWFEIVDEVRGRDYPAYLRYVADHPAMTEWYGDRAPESVLHTWYDERTVLLDDLKHLLGASYEEFLEAWRQ